MKLLRKCYISITLPVICRSLAGQGSQNCQVCIQYTPLYKLHPTSWISWTGGELDTVYKLNELGLYPVYNYKLQAGKLRRRPEILIKIFELYQCSEAVFLKLSAPIFGPRQAALSGSQSGASQAGASRFSVIVENREFTPEKLKKFLKKFFQILDKL